LVTLPVLPLKFLGIPAPDLALNSLYQPFLSNIKSHIGLVDKQEQEKGKNRSASRISADQGLLNRTARTMLVELSKVPQDIGLHNRIGLIYLELGEYYSAITHFDQAVDASRSQISSLNHSAASARANGDLDGAAQHLAEISKINVQLAAAHSSLARVYERLGQSDKMIAQLKELDQEVALSTAFNIKGRSAVEPGTGPGLANQAGKRNRLDHEAAMMLARAGALRQSGKSQDAIGEYKKLIEKLPDLSIAHRELALTALSQQNIWLAEHELEKTIELNNNDATAHNALGDVYLSMGRTEDTKKEYLKSIALDPKNNHAAFSLGNLYANEGRLKEAREAFRTAVKNMPDSAFAHNNLATMCSLTGDYTAAEKEFKQALRLSPDMASAHYGLGIALMNLNRYSQCISSFKTAVTLDPSLVDAHNKIEIAQRKRTTTASIGMP
ncbi:MAG: tetratricopeptide repeat protein, partial [Candidatus Obscuribacterales bacterium]|nr:tetratricopeptide repeat protein [Candidatus Obscuribacterales bacterium]